MFANKNLLAGLTFLALGALTLLVLIPYGVESPASVQNQALAPSFWPNIVAAAILAIGVALTGTSIVSRNQGDSDTQSTGSSGWLLIRPLIALAICFALYFGLEPLGFVLTCSIALAALMILAGEFRFWIVLPIAVLIPFGLHLFFTKAASVPIPMGVLEPLLLRI